METSQILFSAALGSLALLITWFAFYVLSSTMWSNRWFGKR